MKKRQMDISKGGRILNAISAMALLLIILFSGKALAVGVVIKDSIIDGYSACTWKVNKDNSTTVTLLIRFKEAAGHTGGFPFYSRAIAFYAYDKNGVPVNRPAKISMNKKYAGTKIQRQGYVLHYHPFSWRVWQDAFVANVEVVIGNSILKDWPAVSIRAANFTQEMIYDVVEITGAAYIDAQAGNGTGCQVRDPENPVEPPIAINVTAPDWNLGELERGDSEKRLTGSADQLCFTYTGAAVSGKNFIINASNANGVVNNRYRLRHLSDVSQTVPYSVTLQGDADTVSLPNPVNKAVPFSTTGRTCFTPSFRTTVDPRLKEGTYSDVLTFTVVTKS